MNNVLLKKYARLAIQSGVNLQVGQTLLLNTSVEAIAFTREVVSEAYEAGAKQVIVSYGDEEINKQHVIYQSVETLQETHDWQRDARLDYLKEGAATLRIISDLPGLLKDCDAKKINAKQRAMSVLNKEINAFTMASTTQWCIVAAPNVIWAKQVFPKFSDEAAVEALWEQIFACNYVNEAQDPVAFWKQRDKQFQKRMDILNSYAFQQLHFSNSLGTDLYVGLVKNCIWAGGSEKAQNGVVFNANMPTEEIFSMPDRNHVQGHVVATRPLLYNGCLITDFALDFQAGKAVSCVAKEGQVVLEQLLAFDEGSNRLGEVALVPHNSPISQSGILFYTTLFDENASCHLALGDAYPMCMQDGLTMSETERLEKGANQSMVHVDFMFGSSDMKVQGQDKDGNWISVFAKGNFVF